MAENILEQAEGLNWKLFNGDSTEVLRGIPDNSIDFSCFSPPFKLLFTYSSSDRDLGNAKTPEMFWEHYQFIIEELLRITKPGRNCCVHVAQIATTKSHQGVIGLEDFRGENIRAYVNAGWVYHGEVCIDKDPQALRHGQRVLTPTGFVPIDYIGVGDAVIGSNGCATKVVGVWPQGVGECFRVSFSDGAYVDCDGAHRWSVKGLGARNTDNWVVKTTKQLLETGLLSPGGRRRWEIPLVHPVRFDPQLELPLDPYILGALIGDGNMSQRASVSLTSQRWIADEVSVYLPPMHSIDECKHGQRGNDVSTFYISCAEWHRNDVISSLRELGLMGKRAWEKFIPGAYQTASVASRRRLLKGLLDTDGTIKLNGSICFSTTSKELARGVIRLVQGLGGVATLREEINRKYTYKGEERDGRLLWTVCVSVNDDPPFTLPEKLDRWKDNRRFRHREIVSIEPIGDWERTCITVENTDGLFVTEGHVLTHNSQAIRTHSKALLFVQKGKDSSWLRPALADYILVFRKDGENAVPVIPDITNNEWIEWARPIWYGIRETDTLNAAEARTEEDERHICPLQLGTIERCIRLWTNPGEIVLSPFAGIGSEIYEAILLGRKGIGCELKPEYFKAAVNNCQRAENSLAQKSLFHVEELQGG